MPMDPEIEIALIVGLTTFTTGAVAFLASLVQSRSINKSHLLDIQMRQRERTEDWARQDLVAARAEEAAKLLLEQQTTSAEKLKEAAVLLVENNTKVDKQSDALLESSKKIQDKVDAVQVAATQIHGLVNSALTEVKRQNLEGLVRELALMEQIGSSQDQIDLIKARISDATVELADRTQVLEVLKKQGNAE